MKFFATVVFALASVAAAAPNVQPGNEPEGLVPKACGSKYNSCGLRHQPPCCSGLRCASGTCL